VDPRKATLSRPVPAGDQPFVVCAGLVASDFLVPTTFPVPRDVKVRVKGFVRQGGGPAANAAVALARLGARAAWIGAVGDDGLGRSQLDELVREGVDVSGAVAVPGVPSFVSFILVEEAGGARTIFSAPEDRPVLPPDTGLPDPTPHLLLLDGWAGPAGVTLARAARERGVPVLLDAGTFSPEVVRLLPFTEVAIVSTPFAEGIAGGDDPERALERIAEHGPRLVAVTRGAGGVSAGVRGVAGSFALPAFPVETVDTTGAGDAFHAGAAWGLLRGESWEESLRTASAVAALKCGVLGARAGLPDAAALEALLARG